MDRFILTPYFLDEPLPELEALTGPGWQMNRGGSSGPDQRARMSALHEALAGRVERALQAGDRPVSIAGDCCASIGMTAGMQRAGIDPLLIWFDAHGDFNTWETTPSGFVGGMPLAMLVGRGEQAMPQAVDLSPLSEERIILTDARDLDPGEADALRGSRVTHLPKVTDLLGFPIPEGPILVHFDTDVLDPVHAPAMSYPAPGGASLEQLTKTFRHLAGTGKVRGASLSSWNPRLEGSALSARVCMQLLQILLGE
mgnify:CR=1 FL=1|jgi:arginase